MRKAWILIDTIAKKPVLKITQSQLYEISSWVCGVTCLIMIFWIKVTDKSSKWKLWLLASIADRLWLHSNSQKTSFRMLKFATDRCVARHDCFGNYPKDCVIYIFSTDYFMQYYGAIE